MEWMYWQTAAIAAAAAIPLLVLMYFLKLRRIEAPISSTLLWKRAVQDLQVNAPFQRLRRNLLLLLQLICLILILLAVAKPMLHLAAGAGRRYVILIDRSASMSATDVDPSRLDRAKREAKELVASLRGPSMFGLGDEGDKAMVIAFDADARVMCTFTADKEMLNRAIDSIEPRDGGSSLRKAVAVARAYAQSAGEENNNRPAAERAQLELFSDGRIDDAGGITIESGEVVFHRIGAAGDNVGVVQMRARRSLERREEVNVFATLANYGDLPVTRQVELRLNGDLLRVDEVRIPARTPGTAGEPDRPGRTAVSFTVNHPAGGVIEVRKLGGDPLAADDAAWAVLRPPKRLAILLVTRGNLAVERALHACSPGQLKVVSPEEFDKMDHDAMAVKGSYDVIVLDGCAPAKLPRGRFLVLGRAPPQLGAIAGEELTGQAVVDWRARHPVLQHVNLSNVYVARAARLKPPRDAVVLAEFADSPAMILLSRRGSTYLITGFDVLKSNWPFEVSFVMFCVNATKFLGLELAEEAEAGLKVQQAIEVRTGSADRAGKVVLPDGRSVKAKPDSSGTLRFARTDRVGLYTVESPDRPREVFAVNLLDEHESDIRPHDEVVFSGQAVQAAGGSGGKANRDLWPLLAVVAMAVVCLEWFVYNSKLRL